MGLPERVSPFSFSITPGFDASGRPPYQSVVETPRWGVSVGVAQLYRLFGKLASSLCLSFIMRGEWLQETQQRCVSTKYHAAMGPLTRTISRRGCEAGARTLYFDVILSGAERSEESRCRTSPDLFR
jgi:hypothetical protein